VNHYQSILDFRRARRKANRERFLAHLTGRSADLLSYEEVRQMLRTRAGKETGLQDIPLDAIVGSVGRYSDFTRSFLPLHDEAEARWAGVQAKATDLVGLPPIQVYKIGETYFVHDGHHRVSVARQLEATHIQADVTEIKSRVPLAPDVQPDELILKAEYAQFLDQTRLDELCPDADLNVTVPGQYPNLLEHIAVHRYYMGAEARQEIPYPEAVAHWYEKVYLPVVQAIREQDILRDFPERTETDLYLWLSDYHAALEKSLGWEIETEAAATDLAQEFSSRPQRRFSRVISRLLDALTPDELEAGPSPGRWRSGHWAIRRDGCMFANILVLVSGDEANWPAVAQATGIACHESSRLLGLHVVSSAADKKSTKVQELQAEFARQCQMAGVRGKLAIEVGRVARKACERSRWADLIVVSLAHPPAPQPIARLSSGFRTLIRRCPTPVLAVPGSPSSLSRLLLAYDGSPKAREALYVATYLAGHKQVPLVVVTITEDEQVTPEPLAEAGAYIQARGVQATLVHEHGPLGEAILRTASNHDSDLILMGGYGHNPVMEVVLGSTVDEVLRTSRQPMLICR